MKSRRKDEVEAFRQHSQITTFGHSIPNPVQSFSEAPLPKYILDVIQNLNYSKPTPIQSQCKFSATFRLAGGALRTRRGGSGRNRVGENAGLRGAGRGAHQRPTSCGTWRRSHSTRDGAHARTCSADSKRGQESREHVPSHCGRCVWWCRPSRSATYSPKGCLFFSID